MKWKIPVALPLPAAIADDDVLAEILGFLKCKYDEYTVQLYMQKQPPTLEKCSSVTKPPIIYPPSDLPLLYIMCWFII